MHDGVAGRPSDLAAWNERLRARLAAGALADLPPIDLGDGTIGMPTETTVRTMLADLDRLLRLPGSTPNRGVRVEALLEQFRRLRALIG